MMKARNLIVPVTCLLLIGAAGCGHKHKPVNLTVLVPSQGGAKPVIEEPSVLAEKRSILTFELPPDSAPGATLEIQFLNQKGAPVLACDQGILLKGPSPLQCKLKTEGDFTIAISVTAPGEHRPQTVDQVDAYIRPCKACSIP
jgi:hypothetical protein